MLLGILNEILLPNVVITIPALILSLKTRTQMPNNCVKEGSDKNPNEKVVKLGYYLGSMQSGLFRVCFWVFLYA